MLPLIPGSGTDSVFHHHHRPIDNHAKVDRTQTHQIGGNASEFHGDHSSHCREGNGGSDNQASPHIAQQQKQHHNHKRHADADVLSDGMDGFRNKFGAVVEGVDIHPLWQRLVDNRDPVFDVGHHLP